MYFQNLHQPHGNILINLLATPDEIPDLLKKSESLHKIVLTTRRLQDLEALATGVFSPLTGFMVKSDYLSVVKDMRLKNNWVYPMPITLAVSKEETEPIKENKEVAIVDVHNEVLAIMKVEEKFEYDKQKEAKSVYLTDDIKHPGVAALYGRGIF